MKTLMQRMGIEALYRRPRMTKPEPGHKIYPYLLRGTEITRPNQVWAMDVTYFPMARGSALFLNKDNLMLLVSGAQLAFEKIAMSSSATMERPSRARPTTLRSTISQCCCAS